jgi:8-oxo-dGTP pyrophosphatase MutT (NUDIX family)
VIWAPPGGGLEPGETPHEAVLRELIEEVGYEVTLDADPRPS